MEKQVFRQPRWLMPLSAIFTLLSGLLFLAVGLGGYMAEGDIGYLGGVVFGLIIGVIFLAILWNMIFDWGKIEVNATSISGYQEKSGFIPKWISIPWNEIERLEASQFLTISDYFIVSKNGKRIIFKSSIKNARKLISIIENRTGKHFLETSALAD